MPSPTPATRAPDEPDEPRAPDAVLRAHRQEAATALLGLLTGFGMLLVGLYLPVMLAARAYGVIGFSLVIVATSVVLALRPRWSLELRVGWMVVNMFAAALPGLVTDGDRGVAAANLLGSVLTAALLLGWRAAARVLVAIALVFAGVLWGVKAGRLPLPAVARLDPRSALGWVGLWLTITEIALLGVVGAALTDQRQRGLVAELHAGVARLRAALGDLTREREEREGLVRALAETLAAVHTGLWELDVDSGRMRWSDEVARLLRLERPPEAPTLARLLERIHAEDRARLAAALRAERAEVEVRLLPGDEEPRWLRLTASATDRDRDRDRARTVRGLVVDVTGERANARQLHRLAEVASRTGNAVVVTDLEGRIEWVNDAFTRLTGWALPEILGRPPGAFLQVAQSDLEARARMARAIAAREPFDCEILNVARDGRQYWVHIETRVARDESGAPTGFVAVETDVTERRLAARRDSLAERVAALLLASDTIAQAGARLVEELVAELDVRTAQLWLVEPGNPHLAYVAGASATVAGDAGRRFLERSRQLTFGPGEGFVSGVGVPGTAWGTRGTAILPVIASVGSRRLEEATEAGVVSFCGIPVHGPSGVLAVLEVGGTAYYPGHELLPRLLERIAEQLAAFLLHDASRRAFQAVFDRSPDGLLIVAEDGVVEDANARALAMFASPAHQPLDALLEQGAALVEEVLRAPVGAGGAEAPLLQRAARGRLGAFSAEVSASSVGLRGRRGAIIAVRDLTERHRMEAAVTRSLREKETLLKEVHHRVKNNLQIVSSLLALQADDLAPGGARGALEETVHRVRSMALVHQQLYGTEHLDSIDFGAYAATLCRSLVASLDPRAILALDLEPIEVTVDTAVPCGLALNELVTNALKHGRSPDGTCRLKVDLRREAEHVRLTVADHGAGFPDTEAASTSLGMHLLRSLARQLSARLEIGRDVGASITLRLRPPAVTPVASARAGAGGEPRA